MIDKKTIRLYANHFYNLGLNTTCISNERTQWSLVDNNLFKSPCHEWTSLQNERQTTEQLDSYDWEKSIGVGVVLGFEDLMAIDIDGCVDYDFVKFVCDILNIRHNYEWIIKSGSGCGFHILIKCNDLLVDKTEIEKQFAISRWEYVEDFGYPYVNAYYGKLDRVFGETGWHNHYENSILNKYFSENFLMRDLFNKIEFRWKGHSVLPGSLHQSGLIYNFVNGFPKLPPASIPFKSLQELKQTICAEKADVSGCDTQRDFRAYEDNIPFNETWNYNSEHKFLVFDTETNGLPIDFKQDFRNTNNWPRLLQISWLIVDKHSNVIKRESFVVKPFGFEINTDSFLFHGITEQKANLIGEDLKVVLEKFLDDLNCCNKIVCHNYEFDSNVILAEMQRTGFNIKLFQNKEFICTMKSSTNYCKLGIDKGYKYPSLNELYFTLFAKNLHCIHNAVFDVTATKFCFTKLQEHTII